jgi:hypothetical protein
MTSDSGNSQKPENDETRRGWVKPELEVISLRDAMAGASGTADSSIHYS